MHRAAGGARCGERVKLWIQNCYSTPIPSNAAGLRLIGSGDFKPIADEVPPYGSTIAIDPARIFPDARWPAQFEIRADKYFCRPRYEIGLADGQISIAHVNVERTDLKPAPDLAEATRILRQGLYFSPAPLLRRSPTGKAWLLPTPMATGQDALTLLLRVYDADGGLVAERSLGRRVRNEQTATDLDDILKDTPAPAAGYGHLELPDTILRTEPKATGGSMRCSVMNDEIPGARRRPVSGRTCSTFRRFGATSPTPTSESRPG